MPRESLKRKLRVIGLMIIMLLTSFVHAASFDSDWDSTVEGFDRIFRRTDLRDNPLGVFISHAWHDVSTPDGRYYDDWCTTLYQNLRSAGFGTLYDEARTTIVADGPSRFMERVDTVDVILAVCTPTYYQRSSLLLPDGNPCGVKVEVDRIMDRIELADDVSFYIPMLIHTSPRGEKATLLVGNPKMKADTLYLDLRGENPRANLWLVFDRLFVNLCQKRGFGSAEKQGYIGILESLVRYVEPEKKNKISEILTKRKSMERVVLPGVARLTGGEDIRNLAEGAKSYEDGALERLEELAEGGNKAASRELMIIYYEWAVATEELETKRISIQEANKYRQKIKPTPRDDRYIAGIKKLIISLELSSDGSEVDSVASALSAATLTLTPASATKVGGGGPAVVAVARAVRSGPEIPTWVDERYHDIYLRFLGGKLIYRPTQGSDVGKVELPIAALSNPLNGVFDLSGCEDMGNYLSINTGYRKRKNSANANKLEIWFAPRFLIERDSPGHFAGIMGDWNNEAAPIGIFWTWGGWEDLTWYDYLTRQNFAQISDKNLYENWRHPIRTTPHYPLTGTRHASPMGSSSCTFHGVSRLSCCF